MTTTGWNGPTLPTSGDGWNLINHIQTALNTANLNITVSSQVQRDGLAALAPGGVLPVGTTVIRSDLTGLPEEVWTGSSWVRKGLQTAIFNRGSGSDATFTTANTGLVSGTIVGAPHGLWRVEALIGLYGSTSAVGRTYVMVEGTQYKRRQDLTGTPSTYYVCKHDFMFTGTDLDITAGYDVVSGTAAVMSAASGETTLMATFLGN